MRQVARELDMLLLVFADGDEVGVVDEDIRRHQHGIIKKAAVEGVFMLAGFILKLGHALEVAERAYAGEYPSQIGVAFYGALQKQIALFGVEAARHILRGAVEHVAPQVGGDIGNCYCVHIDYAEIAVAVVDECAPIFNSAEVIAQVEFACRLRRG